MTESLKGTCLCNGVEYEVHDPQALAYCHCTRCQRWTGSNLAGVVVAKDDFSFTKGEDLVKTYESDLTPRNFCRTARSSIFDDLGEVYFVAAGLMSGPRHGTGLPPAGRVQGQVAPDRRRRPPAREMPPG